MAVKILSVPGKRYRFRQIEFWAERGMIHFLDLRMEPPEETIATVRDTLLRLRTFNQNLGDEKYADERKEFEKLVEDGIECCRTAQKQGRPDDPRVLDWVGRQRDKHLLLPGPDIGLLVKPMDIPILDLPSPEKKHDIS